MKESENYRILKVESLETQNKDVHLRDMKAYDSEGLILLPFGGTQSEIAKAIVKDYQKKITTLGDPRTRPIPRLVLETNKLIKYTIIPFNPKALEIEKPLTEKEIKELGEEVLKALKGQ